MSADIEIVDRPAVVVVGLPVLGPFQELGTLVPAAWAALSDVLADDGPSAPLGELSVDLGDGRYHETLGLVIGAGDEVPRLRGAVVSVAPAGRWARTTHDGPRDAIAATFGRILERIGQLGHRAGAHKLDIGYRLDGGPERHELFVALG